MPDFDKLQQHANALNELLKDRQEGLSVWCLMVGEHWKVIAEMWGDEDVDTSEPKIAKEHKP